MGDLAKSFYIPNYGATSSDDNSFDSYPVAHISQPGATDFCSKMTDWEVSHGRLPQGAKFRLPTLVEWGQAAHDESGSTYPWGNEWPPRTVDGKALANLNDQSLARVGSLHSLYPQSIPDYDDGFAGTSPVKSFPQTTKEGLYDLGSNVEEWCSDRNGSTVFSRGASWRDSGDAQDSDEPKPTTSRINPSNIDAGGFDWVGFRVVLELPVRS